MTRADPTNPMGSRRPPRRAAAAAPPILRAAAALLLATALGGCFGSRDRDVTASIPNDYRLRHPIAIQEGDQTTELFIGANRGGLTPNQRALVTSFARTWSREATGGIVIELPAGTPNERAAADALPEVQAILQAGGLPPNAIYVQPYHPNGPNKIATMRLRYPRMVAEAGPCGLWPDDIGPNYANPGYMTNKPYHNFGCATQRNLAAMVEDPHDLVQPRGETPVPTWRRTVVLDKYRKGEATGGTYPKEDKGKISDVGK
ncbi:pilus assembly protein [Rhodoplanes elegans]|uniref:Pilus assembly protein CpaD n=2 Tax=Rhodoplanes elegans TaxID=29408 RepID=A0A327KPG4_9BRAD|nr:pilus assembly protein [Rhodoplanes elegans]RAI39255.1 pilus assembly protein CpaD [Rhodoplanes elegans]